MPSIYERVEQELNEYIKDMEKDLDKISLTDMHKITVEIVKTKVLNQIGQNLASISESLYTIKGHTSAIGAPKGGYRD